MDSFFAVVVAMVFMVAWFGVFEQKVIRKQGDKE